MSHYKPYTKKRAQKRLEGGDVFGNKIRVANVSGARESPFKNYTGRKVRNTDLLYQVPPVSMPPMYGQQGLRNCFYPGNNPTAGNPWRADLDQGLPNAQQPTFLQSMFRPIRGSGFREVSQIRQPQNALDSAVAPSSTRATNRSYGDLAVDSKPKNAGSFIASSPIELIVSNLDSSVNSKELQSILLNMLKQYAMVLNLTITTQSDGSPVANVKVGSQQEAQFVISQLHHQWLGCKRMSISCAQTSSDPNQVRFMIVSLLQIPMPTFQQRSANQKLFGRISPRRSAHMNGLNDYIRKVAGTPMNAACTSSSDNSVLQLSPIPGTSKNMQVNHTSNTKQTQENGNATLLGTDKSKNGNQMNLEQPTSRHNCSKKKQNKHVNASVKAVTVHLQRLPETLRKEEKKNQTESHSRVHMKNKKQITEKVAMIAGEKSENSLKETSNNALHRNNGNDLDGIEVLNSRSEEYVTNRAKCAVTLCRYCRFHAQKTILMERQTQTTDSLEKVFKKALPTQTPLKEVKEMVKERSTIRRKIIEAEEPNKERKKPKSLIGEAKENSKKNKKNLQMELQSNATSFENEREELEGQHFERNRQKESVPFDVNVQNNSKMKFDESAFVENFLDHIDSSMKAASVISISSASEDTLKTPTNNVETTLISGKNANSEEISIGFYTF